MKNQLILRFRRLAVACALLGSAVSPALAQVTIEAPRTTVPARPAADTSTSEFAVDGLRVILRRNAANDVVASSLFLLGGTQQLTQETQGIETLLLAASERGTARYPGSTTRQQMARLGSSVIIDPQPDWTVFSLRTIRAVLDSSWAVFADRVIAPTLDSTEVELVRTQILGALTQQRSQPDEELTHLADSLLFTNHPYGMSPEGTVESLARITQDQLRSYHDTQFVKSRMLLVVVGDVERAQVEKLVRGTLSTLPLGNYSWTPPPLVTDTARALVVERRPLPTNYLMGYYAGPRAGTADYTALRIAAAVLSGRFFSEIRSRRNLSYAVEAPFLERAVATGGVYVTTIAPDEVLGIMRTEINRLQTELLLPEALQRLVQQFITDYFLKNETNADQATFLARAALYQGDYRLADDFVNKLRDVTPLDVQSAARRYMHNFRFAYVGDPADLNRALLQRF